MKLYMKRRWHGCRITAVKAKRSLITMNSYTNITQIIEGLHVFHNVNIARIPILTYGDSKHVNAELLHRNTFWRNYFGSPVDICCSIKHINMLSNGIQCCHLPTESMVTPPSRKIVAMSLAQASKTICSPSETNTAIFGTSAADELQSKYLHGAGSATGDCIKRFALRPLTSMLLRED